VIDCKGIVVYDDTGPHTSSATAAITVFDRRRISALRDAAARHLTPTDEVVQALDKAVREDLPEVDIPECFDEHDANVLADVLEDVRNGDDGAPARAAQKLRKVFRQTRTTCPWCDGTGEVDG
jgi:hypothetical protein